MPHAQGSTVVRRRPKDGNPGQDAVRYWLVPSVSTVKKAVDGTLTPTSITCAKYKQTGNNTPVETTEGTLKYKTISTAGLTSTESNYTGAITIGATLSSIVFTLYVSGISATSETVSVVVDGQSSFKSFVFKRAATNPGRPSGGSYTSPVPSGWSDGIPEEDGNPVWMSSRIFTNDGKAPQQSQWTYPQKAVDTADIDFEYSSVATNPGNPTDNPKNWHDTATSDDIWMAVRRYSNGIWGSWEISKIKGERGDDGKDTFILDLSNEMAGIACNSSGTVTGDFPTSTATVYRANTKDTGWTFKVTNTNCTATINANGEISITAISADTASILVTASKTGYADLTATMSLYKVKPGTNGTTPTIYSIEPSANAVTLDSSGNLFPKTLYCYKYAQTGNNTRALTTLHRLTAIPYNLNGIAQTEQVLSANGASNNGSITLQSSWSAVEFILYSGSSNTILDRERVPIVRDGQPGGQGNPGKDGTDGKDSTSYWLVTNVTQVKKTESSVTPSTITCTAMKQTGEGSPTQATGLSIKYVRHTTSDSTEYTYAGSVSFTQATEYLIFRLYDGSTLLAETTVTSVSDGTKGDKGDPGDKGLQGCIVRQTIWTSGVAYKNEVNSTSTGIRYLDIAILEVWNNGVQSFYRFQCVTSHTSSSSNKPSVGMTANAYWQPLSDSGPLYAPIVLADQAVFKLAQTNQIVVMKAEDNTKVNAAMGGGSYPLWIGAEDPMEAYFKVDRYGQLFALNAKLLGEVVAGTEGGQRVALEPDNKAMKVYDADGVEVASFEGNSATAINSLFQNTSGSFTLSTQAANSDSISGNDTNGVSRSNTYILNSGNAIYSATPIEVTFKGSLRSTYSDPPTNYSAGGESPEIMPMAIVPPQIMPDPSIQNPTLNKTAYSYVRVVLKTYNNSSRTTLLGSVTVATVCKDSKTFNVKAKSSVGGYHFLVLEYHISATGSGMTASVAWGTSVTNGTALSATYTSDFYVARYMGNGLVLGTSQQNYIWLYQQANLYMRMMMESNGYGFDFSNTMPKFKHHSGTWQTLPLWIWRAYIYCSSNGSTYYASYSKAPFGSPTVNRQSEGVIRITYHENWVSLFGSFSHTNVRVLLTGVGYVNGSDSAPMKATLGYLGSSYMDIYLSDDASKNDGNFTIDIEYIG